jgi:toxin ParE1/3/4
VVFHRLVAKEVREAEAWYAARSAEAAARFRNSIDAAAQQIAADVGTHAIGRTKFKYARVHRFPYHLIFCLDDSSAARVLAVAHGRRRPGYWRRRQ